MLAATGTANACTFGIGVFLSLWCLWCEMQTRLLGTAFVNCDDADDDRSGCHGSKGPIALSVARPLP